MPTVSAPALAALPAAPVAIVVALLVALVVHPVVGLLVGLAVGAVVFWLALRNAAARTLTRLGARPLDEGAEPRLESLVESICAARGISEPSLYVVDHDAIDAAVVGEAGDTRLVVTAGLLRSLDRLEMEAVVARQLSQFGNGIRAATTLVTVAAWMRPVGPVLRERLLDERRVAAIDVGAVAVTRYPPALASALAKAGEGSRVPHDEASDHLWMLGSESGGVHPDLVERLDTLHEL